MVLAPRKRHGELADIIWRNQWIKIRGARMFLNRINFPNQIIDAVKEDRLVVFAGAGASNEKPTALPGFEKLAVTIAEDTGESKEKDVSCEVFLGSLKFKGIDVNGLAAEIVGDSSLKPNELHKAIVDIFVSPDRIKIVTTNYDEMFEKVIDSYDGVNVMTFDAPALPIGDDVNGIVHLHGSVHNPKNMVITDEDFGKAYLTDGYASRFLVKLFESYTVLFVGYSYNDTILRYLSRAMSRGQFGERFIVTSDKKSNWKSLGITAVYYPKGAYKVMRESLIELGIRTKRGLIEWKKQFQEIAEYPPQDLTIDTEVDYCLNNVERAQILAQCIKGKEWLEVLDRKGVYNKCFSRDKSLSEEDLIWSKWACDNFIGIDDASFKTLIAKHGSVINEEFAKDIIKRIDCEEKDLDNKQFAEYLCITDKYIQTPSYNFKP